MVGLVERLVPAVTRRSRRALLVAAVGPTTSLTGLVWAFVQPWRITLLHPHGQGFWRLLAEAPLLVIGVGILFHLVVALPLLHDLEELER